MKSKYNTGHPMDINELPEEERKIAFHEWAEGSPGLEKLLNEGYKKGFLSYACCAGDSTRPYIVYNLSDDRTRKIAMIVAEKLRDSGLDCEIKILHNFIDTEEEYKQMREYLIKSFPEDYTEENYSPTRTIIDLNVTTRIENREEVFENMAKSIREAEIDNVKLPESEEEVPERKFGEDTKKKISTQKIGQVTVNIPTTAKKEAEHVENEENTRDNNIKEGEEPGDDN